MGESVVLPRVSKIDREISKFVISKEKEPFLKVSFCVNN